MESKKSGVWEIICLTKVKFASADKQNLFNLLVSIDSKSKAV